MSIWVFSFWISKKLIQRYELAMVPTKKFRRWWWRGWYIDSEPMIVVRLRTMMIVVAMTIRWNDWNSDWCLDILCIHTYQNCILVFSIKWREFSYAHLKASGTDVLQPYIHCVTGFCSSCVFRRDKHKGSGSEALKYLQIVVIITMETKS